VHTTTALTAAVALVALAAVSAQDAHAAGGQGASLKNPVQATPVSIEAGQKIYARYCGACHGPKGQGGPSAEGLPPPSNLTDTRWDHGSTDGAIFTAIKSGIPPEYAMEPWGDRIKDPDIWNLVNFIRSLRK